jgi:hypothetical protein
LVYDLVPALAYPGAHAQVRPTVPCFFEPNSPGGFARQMNPRPAVITAGRDSTDLPPLKRHHFQTENLEWNRLRGARHDKHQSGGADH